jgi:hypothetical protein
LVYRVHDRRPVFERRTQTRNDVVVDIRDLQEFLKIKREHFTSKAFLGYNAKWFTEEK